MTPANENAIRANTLVMAGAGAEVPKPDCEKKTVLFSLLTRTAIPLIFAMTPMSPGNLSPSTESPSSLMVTTAQSHKPRGAIRETWIGRAVLITRRTRCAPR